MRGFEIGAGALLSCVHSPFPVSEAVAGARDSVAEAVAGARESVSEAVAGVRTASSEGRASTPDAAPDEATQGHEETNEK